MNETEIDYSENIFKRCTKCSIYQKTIRDLMKHLVEFHPIPIIWMSDKMDINCSIPYTIVTESRKKRKKNSTPRPLNSFMIFSRHLRRVILLFFADASNSEISKLLGKYWSSLPVDTKSLYDSESKRLAILHSKEFPDYKYKPQKKKKNLFNKTNNNEYIPSNFQENYNRHKENPKLMSEHSTKNLDDTIIKKHAYSRCDLPLHTSSNVSVCTVNKRRKVTISNLTSDYFDDTESSVSSSKLPNKTDIFQSISPMSDQSFECLFEQSQSSAVSKFVQYNNGTHFPKFSIGNKLSEMLNCNQEFTNRVCIKSEEVSLETSIPFTRPLSIITESIDSRAIYVSGNDNKKSKNDRPSEYYYYKIINPFNNNTDSSNEAINFVKITNATSKCVINVIPKIEPVSQEIVYLRPDPLITADVCNNEHFDTECFNIDSEYKSPSSPWLLQSPTYKMSTVSSTSSDNNCHEFYGSPSPFLLSESEQTSFQIQKLPAIGSWIRSNISEFTI